MIFWHWNIFNRRKRKKMSKREKKKFLSNDFIDRMIQVERNVSASLGEKKEYFETEYYNSLNNSQKRLYQSFLKSKISKRTWLFYGMIVSSILIPFFKTNNLTGGAVGTKVGTDGFVSFIPLILLGVFVGIFLVFSIRERIKEKRVTRHTKIVDEIIRKKRKK
ncbi:hypothetical protein B6U91_02355 [Candidatus Pacearchaeota archaeon ex4484_71]|nr:MAG: hypothetical protein B6U91_02355 [Candidatus Pacearchaeota archaeon ex4484_71]